MKTWTYEEITKAAEADISMSVKLAREAQEQRDWNMVRIHYATARGAYLLWDRITCGWRDNDEDEKRLEILSKL